MEFIKNILSWVWENIFDIALVIVGASAFFTYILQQRNEKRTAATLIIEQIDSIENIIEDLKNTYIHNNNTLDDNSVYLSKEISYDGAWTSYKHLVIHQLSNSEFCLVQKFFNSAYQIEKTRSDIIYCFKLSWNNKSLVTQLMKMANSNVASKVTNFQSSQKLVNYLKHITFLKRNLTPYLKD